MRDDGFFPSVTLTVTLTVIVPRPQSRYPEGRLRRVHKTEENESIF